MMNEIGSHNLNGCINTYSGKKFDLINPRPDMVDIRDIARGLAYKAHFAGQTEHYFSIAQHCLLVCDLIPDDLKKDSRFMMLALMHDAAEAYIGDMVKPLKVYLPEYCLVEDKIMSAVCLKFRLDQDRMKELKKYDIQAQQMEYDNFYKGAKSITNYHSPIEAARLFKLRYILYYSN
jgi:5'-deoxynucleotidase YfbR-like HD superfamily hydrolase